MSRFTFVATRLANALGFPAPVGDRPLAVLAGMGYVVNAGSVFGDYHAAAILTAGNLAHERGFKHAARQRIAIAAGSLAARRVGTPLDSRTAAADYEMVADTMSVDDIILAGQIADQLAPHLSVVVGEDMSRSF